LQIGSGKSNYQIGNGNQIGRLGKLNCPMANPNKNAKKATANPNQIGQPNCRNHKSTSN
jgi:hypothetical protein